MEKNKKFDFMAFGDIGQYLPKFIETRAGDWVLFGEDNLWPELIVRLYNQSSMNRSCLLSKYDAVIGKGLISPDNPDILQRANPKENWNDVFEKCALDYILHGGFCVNVIWNIAGNNADIYHTDFTKIRSGKPNQNGDVDKYYYCMNWREWRKNGVKEICKLNRDYIKEHPSQLCYAMDYSPGNNIYPLSDWVGAVNDCLTDIQTSIFHNSNLQNGLVPSLWISFKNGIPDPQEQSDIYQRINDTFAGSDKAGKFFISFSDDASSAPEINPLRAENDTYYIQLDQRVISRILTAHRISSPLLLGIRDTGGGLGSNKDEIIVSYEHFISTCIKPIQKFLLKEFQYLIYTIKGEQCELQIEQRELFESGLETQTTTNTPENSEANEYIRKLSGREYQGLFRIVRQYNQQKISLEQAKTMLQSGYALTEEQINTFLGLNQEEE